MKPSDRDRLGEQLSAYLDGELSAEERAEVEALVAADPEAQALLADLEQSIHAVKSLPRKTAPASILDDLAARIERNEVLGPAEGQESLGRHRRRPLRSLLAMAATITIVVGAGLWVTFQLDQPEAIRKTASVDRGLAEKERPSLSSGDVGKSEMRQRALGESGSSSRQPKGDQYESLGLSNAANDIELVAPEAKKGPLPTEHDRGEQSAQRDDLSTLFADARKAHSDLDAGVGGAAPTSADETGASLAEAPPSAPPAAMTPSEKEAPADAEETLRYAQGPAPSPGTVDAKSGIERATRARTTARRLAGRPAPPPSTLEQKLAAGEDLTVLQTHPFNEEPVQITLAFADTHAQQVAVGQLDHFLAKQDLPSVDSAVWSYGKADEAPSRARGRLSAPSRAEQQTLQYRGRAAANYVPVNPSDERILVRMPAEDVDNLVDLVAAAPRQSRSIRMQLGSLSAEGGPAVKRLARLAAGELLEPVGAAAPPSSGREAGQPSSAVLSLLSKRKNTQVDLLDLMHEFGLGLPAPRQAAGEQAEETTSRPAPKDVSAQRTGSHEGLSRRTDAAKKQSTAEAEDVVTLVIELITEGSSAATKPATQPSSQATTHPAPGP